MKLNLYLALTGITCFLYVMPRTGECRDVRNVHFPEAVMINGRNCILNGVAVREIMCFDIYIGALYLEQPTGSGTEAIVSEQIKCVQMHFLYKEIKPDQIVGHCMNGFEKNSGTMLSRIRERISRFFGFFTFPLKRGDTLCLTYIPEKGTEVMLRGELTGIIEGRDFMELIASNWLGPHPPSQQFKRDLLGEVSHAAVI